MQNYRLANIVMNNVPKDLRRRGVRRQTRKISIILPLKLPCFWTMATNTSCTTSCFPVKSDVYHGVTVDSTDVNFSENEFENILAVSLLEWAKTGVRGVWFQINIQDSSYIPILVKHGFQFHHAKASYVMLTRWLPEDELNLLPLFPHTHIGVGGLVINEQNQVLVIREKYHKKPHWKLPGGYANPGEEFSDTAHREVLEETGIDTEFVSLVSLRHMHQHLFDCSDIYVVCHMQPLNNNITRGKEEIAECQWMDIQTYKEHPDTTDFNRFIVESFLESQQLKAAIYSTPVLSYTKDRYHPVYTVKAIEKPQS